MLKKLKRKFYQKRFDEASANYRIASDQILEYINAKIDMAYECGWEVANNLFDKLIEHQEQVRDYWMQIEDKWYNKVMSTYETRSF